MKKILSLIAVLLIVAGCSMISELSELSTPEPTPSNLSVIETWTGYAKGRGAECSDAEVEVQVLEDYSITGYAHATHDSAIIKLRGKLAPDGAVYATGSGTGGLNVTYEGVVNGSTASGKWQSSHYSCYGTWEMAKN